MITKRGKTKGVGLIVEASRINIQCFIEERLIRAQDKPVVPITVPRALFHNNVHNFSTI